MPGDGATSRSPSREMILAWLSNPIETARA